MKKVKIVIDMKDLGKIHTKSHLKRLFPFLENEYRKINKDELKSKDVFTELFPGEDFDAEKLRRLFLYQN